MSPPARRVTAGVRTAPTRCPGLGNACTLADQIREAPASRKVQNEKTAKSYGTVTISISVAKSRLGGESLEALVQRAD